MVYKLLTSLLPQLGKLEIGHCSPKKPTQLYQKCTFIYFGEGREELFFNYICFLCFTRIICFFSFPTFPKPLIRFGKALFTLFYLP